LPSQGGGTQIKSVQNSLSDRVPGHGPHWEAGPIKESKVFDSLGRPRIDGTRKVKINE